MNTILNLLTNNIPLTIGCSWLIILPSLVIYQKISSRVEKFPTTIQYDKKFQKFNDALKSSNTSKKGF